jgi:hypothetical protein
MGNYVKSTNFAAKDNLPKGDPLKVVKGTELDVEFNAIATSIISKANNVSPSFTGTPFAPTAVPGTATNQIATTAFVAAARTAVLEAVYPVGSIYTNATNATNPGTLLGFGTWTAFGAGRVMVGFNAADPLFDSAEETGGTKDAAVVSHTHSVTGTAASQTLTGSYDTGFRLPGTNADASGIVSVTEGGGVTSWAASGSGTRKIINVDATHSHSVTGTAATTGTSGTNANIQPYITVYLWKRTA